MARIQTIMDARGGEIARGYEQLSLGMQGAWMAFTYAMANPLLARVQLSDQLTNLVDAHTPLLARHARGALAAAHAQGVLDSQAQHYMDEAPAPLLDEVQATVESAAARDMRGLLTLSQQTLVRYSLARRRNTDSVARAMALGELPGQGRDVFVQLDRLQRKRSSGDFVTASVRMAMFATYVNAFAAAVASAGGDTVIAEHPEKDPVELKLLDGFSAWAAENTHPNSRWSLRPKELRK